MAETTNNKKTYERPSLEKKQKLPDVVQGGRAAISGEPP